MPLIKAILKVCQDLREDVMTSVIDGMGVNSRRRACGMELTIVVIFIK